MSTYKGPLAKRATLISLSSVYALNPFRSIETVAMGARFAARVLRFSNASASSVVSKRRPREIHVRSSTDRLTMMRRRRAAQHEVTEAVRVREGILLSEEAPKTAPVDDDTFIALKMSFDTFNVIDQLLECVGLGA